MPDIIDESENSDESTDNDSSSEDSSSEDDVDLTDYLDDNNKIKDESLSNLYRSYIIIRDVLEYRGIKDIPEELSKIILIKAFIKGGEASVREKINMYIPNVIVVLWANKIDAQYCTTLTKILDTYSTGNLICITDTSITSQAKKTLASIRRIGYLPTSEVYTKRDYQFSIFTLDEVITSRLDHTLVPEHSILPKRLAECLRREYGVKTSSNLPGISIDDIIVRLIGARLHDIIMIKNESTTLIGKFTFTFRIVNKTVLTK